MGEWTYLASVHSTLINMADLDSLRYDSDKNTRKRLDSLNCKKSGTRCTNRSVDRVMIYGWGTEGWCVM